MAQVHLRPIKSDNLWECLRLKVADGQLDFVATNADSLAQASVNAALVPLAVYDVASRGFEKPPTPMVGFTVYELEAGVGFILRLMIDRHYQRKGYGKATMLEVIRRLRLHPEVEMIATSYRRNNEAAAKLYESLGFVPREISFAKDGGDEVFVRLPE
jgi:diamine N-acetyltransferase